jgi:hypothetical protein
MSNATNDVDLSPYERARLANIARNRALLQQLGLADAPTLAQPASAPIKAALAQAFSPATTRKPKREARAPVEVEGLRRSSRLLSLSDADAAHARQPAAAAAELNAPQDLPWWAVPADPVGDVNYQDDEVLLPEQLDDFEFEVYTMLRAWRLSVCRPLQLEPYKVFQNRTLVEAVRRRRNDAAWGSSQQQLLECWGIGPVKVPTPLPFFLFPPPPPPNSSSDALAGSAWRLCVAAHRANAAARR